MKSFEEKIFNKVKKLKKKIVFVDWLDERLYKSLEKFIKLDQQIIISRHYQGQIYGDQNYMKIDKDISIDLLMCQRGGSCRN